MCLKQPSPLRRRVAARCGSQDIAPFPTPRPPREAFSPPAGDRPAARRRTRSGHWDASNFLGTTGGLLLSDTSTSPSWPSVPASGTGPRAVWEPSLEAVGHGPPTGRQMRRHDGVGVRRRSADAVEFRSVGSAAELDERRRGPRCRGECAGVRATEEGPGRRLLSAPACPAPVRRPGRPRVRGEEEAGGKRRGGEALALCVTLCYD